jgi:hypothetical protein
LLGRLAAKEIEREAEGNNIPESLPEFVELDDRELNIYFDLWMKWSIIYAKKFTIKQILEEPVEMSDAVMEIESRYQKLLGIMRKNAR